VGRVALVSGDHIDDMINLPELSEQSVLNNLKVRYQKQIIYVRRARSDAYRFAENHG